jgi:hypothetical protein
VLGVVLCFSAFVFPSRSYDHPSALLHSLPLPLRQTHFEAEKRRKILSTFLEGRVSGSSGKVSVGARDEASAVLDTLSFFVRIVTPPLRPVNFDLLVGKEKEDIETLVGVLLSWSVTFRASHDDFGRDLNNAGGVTYRMDPCVLAGTLGSAFFVACRCPPLLSLSLTVHSRVVIACWERVGCVWGGGWGVGVGMCVGV